MAGGTLPSAGASQCPVPSHASPPHHPNKKAINMEVIPSSDTNGVIWGRLYNFSWPQFLNLQFVYKKYYQPHRIIVIVELNIAC